MPKARSVKPRLGETVVPPGGVWPFDAWVVERFMDFPGGRSAVLERPRYHHYASGSEPSQTIEPLREMRAERVRTEIAWQERVPVSRSVFVRIFVDHAPGQGALAFAGLHAGYGAFPTATVKDAIAIAEMIAAGRLPEHITEWNEVAPGQYTADSLNGFYTIREPEPDQWIVERGSVLSEWFGSAEEAVAWARKNLAAAMRRPD